MIRIVGLGQEIGDLTLRENEALLGGDPVILRTERHPIAAYLKDKGIPFETLDALYEASEDYDDLLAAIAARVVGAEPCVYAVPGGAGLLDKTVCAVTKLAAKKGVKTQILPGVGLGETASAANQGLPFALVLPAADLTHALVNVRVPLLLTELYDPFVASESKLLLQEHYPQEHIVYLGAKALPLTELDRLDESTYSHLATLYVPPIALLQAERYDLGHLREVLAILRDPVNGCPWDKVQTHATLRKDLIEECYEAVEAIDLDDPAKLEDELGDVLLQIGMHAQIAEESADFTFDDVITDICRKMITRHTHIFGDAHADTAEQVIENWNALKQAQRGQTTLSQAADGLCKAYPALIRAEKIIKLAKLNKCIHPVVSDPMKSLESALNSLKALTGKEDTGIVNECLGELFLSCVAVAREHKVSGELALNAAADRLVELSRIEP